MRVARQFMLMVGPVMLIFLASCRTPNAQNFSQLKIGMDKDEVLDLLGPPSSKWTPAASDDEQDPPSEWSARWQYGDCLSSAASTAIAPDIAPDRVWVVRFDEDDRVIGFRTPIRHPNGMDPAAYSPIQSRYDQPTGLPPK